jgi:hypothetical protein
MILLRNLMLILCLLMMGAPWSPVQAASNEGCYSNEEFEAEQGLRLHTDLEVVMLTCKYDGYRTPLRDHYAKFLKKNSVSIQRWEGIIARTYARAGGARNEVIDNFRTMLANQKSGEAGRITPRQFCIKYANWVPVAASWNANQVSQYIRNINPEFPPKKPLCNR